MATLFGTFTETVAGTEYTFRTYKKEEASSIQDENVIYLFLNVEELPTHFEYKILYIGKTATSVSTRMANHHKWDEASRKGFSHIAICKVDGRSLDRIEDEFIETIDPPLNERA